MVNIFITGDRSMDPMTSVQLVHALIQDLVDQYGADELALGTGNAGFGVERAVRYLIPERVLNILPYQPKEDGKPDFADAFKTLAEQTDVVYFLHADPLSSSIGRALSATFPPEKIKMPMQEVGIGIL